ncbi:hypothetical protein KRR38_28280 [Novosphingobium sp. G106]|uniref:bestrophin-like domain n=1 Tax=Novosphingobium sp. G106 TaxID=2849500 RepID=UPI001C2D2A88|nr:hypothetical protein [Novosphingobium sp. G106]MBV1691476.1 hypothetical protein [Novosphingobium sp. G106]
MRVQQASVCLHRPEPLEGELMIQSLDSVTQFPLMLMGILLFMLVVAATWGGMRFRRYIDDASPAVKQDDADDAVKSTILPAVLGLLSLLLGFTFSLAVDRYETRRGSVLEEANAIGTAYLQSQLLGEPHRGRLSEIFVRYTDNRIALTSPAKAEEHARQLALNDQLLTDLWAASAAGFDSIQHLDFSSTFVSSINSVIDLDTSRKTARMARVPNEVFAALIIYVLIAAAFIGYGTLTRTGFYMACVMHILVVLSLLLILDIDRPNLGGIREPQLPMIMLSQALHSKSPEAFDRWRPEQLEAGAKRQLSK